MLERGIADPGIQSVPAGGYPEAFAELAGDSRETAPDAVIVLAGMVGSRNGWVDYVSRVVSLVAEVPRDREVAVVCGSGYRASIAASFLKRRRYGRVINVLGGMSAYSAAGFLTET